VLRVRALPGRRAEDDRRAVHDPYAGPGRGQLPPPDGPAPGHPPAGPGRRRAPHQPRTTTPTPHPPPPTPAEAFPHGADSGPPTTYAFPSSGRHGSTGNTNTTPNSPAGAPRSRRGGPGGRRAPGASAASALSGLSAVSAPPARRPGSANRAADNRRSSRPDVRALFSQRRGTLTAIAAAVLFLAAMLVGMAVFSPNSSSADPSPTTSPSTSATQSGQ
ncbi:hypothetical protein OK074_4308, partial [Actinobacteria bacterium OK074]